MTHPPVTVTDAHSLQQAVEQGAAHIQVQGKITGLSSLKLPAGTRLRGAAGAEIHFREGQPGLMLSADHQVSDLRVVTDETQIALDLSDDEEALGTLLAIDLREPGNEQVIFLELAGDRGGYQVVERDPMQSLAMNVAQAGSGMPLTLLAAPHLARAAQVRCGAQTWTRRSAETREDFARRVQLALIDHAAGRIMESDEASDLPTGPTLLITDQPHRALNPGDTVICFQPGVTQPSGVAVHGLRGLLDTL